MSISVADRALQPRPGERRKKSQSSTASDSFKIKIFFLKSLWWKCASYIALTIPLNESTRLRCVCFFSRLAINFGITFPPGKGAVQRHLRSRGCYVCSVQQWMRAAYNNQVRRNLSSLVIIMVDAFKGWALDSAKTLHQPFQILRLCPTLRPTRTSTCHYWFVNWFIVVVFEARKFSRSSCFCSLKVSEPAVHVPMYRFSNLDDKWASHALFKCPPRARANFFLRDRRLTSAETEQWKVMLFYWCTCLAQMFRTRGCDLGAFNQRTNENMSWCSFTNIFTHFYPVRFFSSFMLHSV